MEQFAISLLMPSLDKWGSSSKLKIDSCLQTLRIRKHFQSSSSSNSLKIGSRVQVLVLFDVTSSVEFNNFHRVYAKLNQLLSGLS